MLIGIWIFQLIWHHIDKRPRLPHVGNTLQQIILFPMGMMDCIFNSGTWCFSSVAALQLVHRAFHCTDSINYLQWQEIYVFLNVQQLTSAVIVSRAQHGPGLQMIHECFHLLVMLFLLHLHLIYVCMRTEKEKRDTFPAVVLMCAVQ